MERADHTTWNIGLSPACEAAFRAYLDLRRREIAAMLSPRAAGTNANATPARPA